MASIIKTDNIQLYSGSTLTITPNTAISGTLAVTGAVTLSSTLNVTGATVLAAVSATTGTFTGLTSGRIPVVSTGGLLIDDSGLTFDTSTNALTATTFLGNVSGTSGTFSSLTSGRVALVSTAGLLADDADMTFSGNTLTVHTAIVSTGTLTINSTGITNSDGFSVPYTGGIGKNGIINGDMTVPQRGTSFAAIADSTYSLDRWRYNKSGATVHTVTQDTDVPTVAQAGRLFTHSMKLALTTADTAIAAGDFCIVVQPVEGYNFRALAQRIITLSFWIKSPITGIHCASLVNSGNDRSIVKEFTISVVNTWEKKTLTFAASPSAGTWDYINGIGCNVRFCLAAGSTFQTTADTWQTGNFLATANQVNGVNTGITPYFITGVQLEAGSVATEFEGRQFEQEYALCRRYYQKSFALGTAPAQNLGANLGELQGSIGKAGASNNWLSKELEIPMRVAPTVTTYSTNTTSAQPWNFVTSVTLTSVAVTVHNEKHFSMSATGDAGGSVGDLFGVQWQAVAEL